MRGFGEAVYEYIRANVPEEDILTEEPMSRHTTFRIGGEAACFIRISSEEQLRKLIPYFENVGVEYFVLGKGSNLLVGDRRKQAAGTGRCCTFKGGVFCHGKRT